MAKKKDETNDSTKPRHADRGILADLGQAAAAGLTAAGKIVEATGKGASALGEAAGGAVDKHEAKKSEKED
jgi:hypothetical protein